MGDSVSVGCHFGSFSYAHSVTVHFGRGVFGIKQFIHVPASYLWRELGIGNAMVYAMYKPVAQDDDEAICALLKLYKKLYQIIGTIILVIGLCILPFVEKLVHGSYPARY